MERHKPRACHYAFLETGRPHDSCGLPTSADRDLCIWHDPEHRPADCNIRDELEARISQPDHWLEGAMLAGQDLSNLNLFRAKLPRADLQLSNLNSAFLAESRLTSCNLRAAKLEGAKLNKAILDQARLDQADASGANLEDASLAAATLQGTCLHGAYLHGVTLSGETLSYNADWGLPGEFLDSHFDRAAHVFRSLSTHFRSLSHHRQSVRFYFLEMTALHLDATNAPTLPPEAQFERLWFWFWLAVKQRPRWKSMGWLLHRWLWGYGVEPWRPLIWMACILLLFGVLIFPIIGIDSNNRVAHDALSGMSLSFVTFATLGYGNRVPHGLFGEFLGGLEALLGALLTSVFLVSLATRYVHRG